MTRDPMVEFVVPMHNAEGTVQRTLESLAGQTDPRWNAIVIDDGSTDRSAEVVRSIRDERISLQYQRNAGVSAARNRAFARASSPFICFLDADDTLEARYIARLLPVAERSGMGAACACDYRAPDSSQVFPAAMPTDRAFSIDAFKSLDCPPIMSVLHRRSALGSVAEGGHLFDESLDAFEDLDLLIRLRTRAATDPSWLFAGETLAHYWLSPSSLSSDSCRVHACGLEILRRYAATDRGAARSWTLRSLAACLAADDAPGAARRLEELGALRENEPEAIDPLLRWHVRRRYAIGEHRLVEHADRVRSVISVVLGDDPHLPRLLALIEHWSTDRWAHAVRVANDSRPPDGRLVIYGLGRNGQQILDACRQQAVRCIAMDDDPARLPEGVRSLPIDEITADDVVLITPDDASSIVRRIESLTPARVWTLASILRHTAGVPGRTPSA